MFFAKSGPDCDIHTYLGLFPLHICFWILFRMQAYKKMKYFLFLNLNSTIISQYMYVSESRTNSLIYYFYVPGLSYEINPNSVPLLSIFLIGDILHRSR